MLCVWKQKKSDTNKKVTLLSDRSTLPVWPPSAAYSRFILIIKVKIQFLSFTNQF